MFARSRCPSTMRPIGRSGSPATPTRRPTSCSSRCRRASYEGLAPLVFTEAHTRGDIRIRPTSGATLLGYPYGFYDQKHFLPVWKTGHVASEPSVDFEGRPVFLVDVSAFPGMSGSPVLAVANGLYETEDGSMRSGPDLEAARHLLGDAGRPRAPARGSGGFLDRGADDRNLAPARVRLEGQPGRRSGKELPRPS